MTTLIGKRISLIAADRGQGDVSRYPFSCEGCHPPPEASAKGGGLRFCKVEMGTNIEC